MINIYFWSVGNLKLDGNSCISAYFCTGLRKQASLNVAWLFLAVCTLILQTLCTQQFNIGIFCAVAE